MYSFSYTENNIKKIIEYQRKFWESKGIEPNCIALGSETLNIFILKDWLELRRNKDTGKNETWYGDLKVYADGWEPVAISVFYNPFFNDYFFGTKERIEGLDPLMFKTVCAEMPAEEDGAELNEE